jgi:hypothetical protein
MVSTPQKRLLCAGSLPSSGGLEYRFQLFVREARNSGLIGGETVDGQELIWIASS